MLYNPKIQFASVNGINVTHYGDVTCEHSIEGDAINKVKGVQGDAVTIANFEQFDTFRITQNVYSPLKGQVKNWAKFKTPLAFQYKDDNTGETKSSTTAYVQSYTEPTDGGQWEVIIYCEEVK